MQELSRAFKDRPMTPQELVVYWTEYVLRHNGTPYLEILGTEMPLYKYLLLDIVLTVFIVIIIAAFVVRVALKRVHALVKRKFKSAPIPKKISDQ